MAVNRYMKPAAQPLMETYVPLPFKEMSLAYATKQQEHDEGETLAGTLDDELLKVRASRPRDVQVLSQYKANLENAVSTLYDKHNGKYADMIPDLKLLKKQVDSDLLSGDLYSINESTKQYEKLQKQIAKSQTKGDYDTEFNPYLGGEGVFTDWYMQGVYFDEDEGVYKLDEEGGWNVGADGRSTLNQYLYSGLHPKVDELDEVNTGIFDKIKPDMWKWSKDKFINGRNADDGVIQQSSERRVLDLAKIYKASYDNVDFLSSGFKQELDLVVGQWMGDEQNIKAATNVIENMFGPDADLNADQKAKKQELLDGLTEEDENGNVLLTPMAYKLSKANYIAQMGEKYLMDEQSNTIDYQNIGGNKSGKDSVYKNFRSIIEGQTVVRTMAQPRDDLGTPIHTKSKSAANHYQTNIRNAFTNWQTLETEYEYAKNNYTLDNEQKDEYENKINEARYVYQAAALSQQNLFQQAARKLDIRKLKSGDIYFEYEGETKLFGKNDPEIKKWGLHLIEWGPLEPSNDSQYAAMVHRPIDIIQANLRATDDQPYVGEDFAGGFWKFLAGSDDPSKSPLFITANSIAEETNWFEGRDYTQPTAQTSYNPKLDEELFNTQKTNWLLEDYHFLDSRGNRQSLVELADEGIIDGDATIELITNATYNNGQLPITWTLTPGLSGSYEGFITIPAIKDLNGDKVDGATRTLFFQAPKELTESWWSVTEDYDDNGMKIFRPTTTAERVNLEAMFIGQVDLIKALDTPGNIGMSFSRDGDGNALGYYYMNELPDGTPVIGENFVFQPRKGLIKDIASDGSYIYTTGDELFNVDSYVDDIGRVIALNDPSYASTKQFWENGINNVDNKNSLPIAPMDRIITNSSMANVIDEKGFNYKTKLFRGQMQLGGGRVNNPEANYNNKQFKGLNIQFADEINKVQESFTGINDYVQQQFMSAYSDSDTKTIMAVANITLSDGQTMSLLEAQEKGLIKFIPSNYNTNISDGSGNITQGLRISSNARSYQTQKTKYDAWIAGGKKGPQVANPDIGGFHVLGQAIDISQNPQHYDWYIADQTDLRNSGSAYISYGGQDYGTSAIDTYAVEDGMEGKLFGFSMSNLKIDGTTLFPEFDQNIVNWVVNSLNQTGTGDKIIRQFPKEWWHFSIGEMTQNKPAVYPSW